ncbi:MAG: hypothetical protein II536_03190, partial [Clostridia bacterium]|nr:hypothetical protein [Clostridia bacterium]
RSPAAERCAVPKTAAPFAEKRPCGSPEADALLGKLIGAFAAEESCPGVLLGYLSNGTIVGWLKALKKLDKPKKKQ